MLVDNYYNGLLKFYCGNNVSGLTFTSEKGYSTSIGSWSYLDWTHSRADIYFGTNNSKPTRQDYWLRDEEAIKGLIEQNITYKYELLEDGIKITRVMNIYNSNEVSVTIGEMVWRTVFHEAILSEDTYGILDRTTFDEPIILSPGESKQINYSIYFKYGN